MKQIILLLVILSRISAFLLPLTNSLHPRSLEGPPCSETSTWSRSTSLGVQPVDTLLENFSLIRNMDPSLRNAGVLVAGALTVGILRSLAPPTKVLSTEQVNQVAQNTFLDKKQLTCVYKASQDGWSAINFHDKVDGQGAAIVAILLANGSVIGGFNPNGWRSTDDYYLSTSAFLYCYRRSNYLKKYKILSGGNAAVFDYATGGPCFGASDLQLGAPRAPVMGGFAGPDMENLAANAGSLRQGSSVIGTTYDTDDNWPVRGTFSPVEVEVYCLP